MQWCMWTEKNSSSPFQTHYSPNFVWREIKPTLYVNRKETRYLSTHINFVAVSGEANHVEHLNGKINTRLLCALRNVFTPYTGRERGRTGSAWGEQKKGKSFVLVFLVQWENSSTLHAYRKPLTLPKIEYEKASLGIIVKIHWRVRRPLWWKEEWLIRRNGWGWKTRKKGV